MRLGVDDGVGMNRLGADGVGRMPLVGEGVRHVGSS